MTTRRMLGRTTFGIVGAGLVGLPLARRAEAQGRNLFEVISSAPQGARFAQLIRMAGAEGEFTQNRQLTVFAPTNAALERVSAFQLAEIMRDQAQARRLVMNHLVLGNHLVDLTTSGASMGTDSFRTLGGGNLSVDFGSGGLPRANGQPIIFSNVRASNGVIHLVDGVLMP